MSADAINKFNRIQTVGTGLPLHHTTQPTAPTDWKSAPSKAAKPFSELLSSQLKEKTGINFSKHAMARISARDIDVDRQLDRLQDGFQTAAVKGLNDALILIDNSAYIVSVKNNTVVTTVPNANLRGNTFTNIDGTVIA